MNIFAQVEIEINVRPKKVINQVVSEYWSDRTEKYRDANTRDFPKNITCRNCGKRAVPNVVYDIIDFTGVYFECPLCGSKHEERV